MSNVGGSANINGILYQILGTLDKAFSLTLEGAVTSSDAIKEARLIVEPAGGGGDVRYSSHSGRVVQQWKAKARGGTWPLQKIVEEVLPDLYLAVPNDDLDADCRYEFVTEGTRGKWDETLKFFQSLPKPPTPNRIIEALQNTPKRHKVGKASFSDRELFQHLVDIIRKRDDVRDEPEDLTKQKVWHLLMRFVMENPVNQEQLVARINEFLIHHVEIAEDVDGKRCELCGVLLEAAAEGDRSLTAEWLLRKACIPLYSFRDWPRLLNRMRDRLCEQLRKEQYDRSLDVRLNPTFQDGVTIISGESGQGKTWQLARLASEVSEGESLVVWVPSSRETASVPDYVAHEVWNYGLQRDAQLSLERVAARREHTNTPATKPWLTVCVDDVRSFEEALSLQNLDWSRWGISLSMSTTPEVSQRIAMNVGRSNSPVRDFSHSETREYLERRGLSWIKIAQDLRELIRRPILAKIYADIAIGEPTFNPRTEYDMMDAAWRRIAVPTDIGLVRKLAGTLQQQSPLYPWPAEHVLEHGGSAEAVERLTQQGWLRDAGDGKVAAWHLRFLCWAYAKFLVAEFESEKLSIDRLGEIIQQCHRQDPPGRIQLGYVPMDVLWLLLEPNSSSRKNPNIWKLIAGLETYAGIGHEDETLYKHLLASLGERVVPALIDRTKHSGEDKHNPIPRRAAEALLLIGRHQPGTVLAAAKRCKADGHTAMEELSLRLAIAFPASASAERVWEIYRRHIARKNVDGNDYIRQELAAKSFSAVAEEHPAWFRQKLHDGDDDDSCLAALVYALGSLGDNEQAREIWFSTKEHLFRVVPSHKRRCLISCITNFGDVAEYWRLEGWAESEEEFVGGYSVWALAYRSPIRALAVLDKVPVGQFMGTAGHISRALLLDIPEDVCSEVERLIRKKPENATSYVEMLAGHGDRLSASTVSTVLDWLERCLEAYLASSGETGRGQAWHGLRSVQKLYGRAVLQELRKRRGSPLETKLLEFARSRIPKISQYVDHEFEQAADILKRIAGDGFTKLINSLIMAEHRQMRIRGCEAAVIRPDNETRELLRNESLSEVMWESGSSGINLVQMRAIDSLAAMGESSGVIQGILRWGMNVSPYIGDLREGQPPMSNEVLLPATELLERPCDARYPNAILAIGISGRADLQKQIEDVFLRTRCADRIAQACLLALSDLATNCDDILHRLIEQYQSGHYKYAVLKVLGSCDVPREKYIELLPGANAIDDMDERVVRFLAGDEKIRPLIDRHIRGLIASGNSLFHDTSALLNPDCDHDRELLWNRSLQPDFGFHVMGTKSLAIKGLGEASPEAAFEIGLESLLTDRRDRETIPRILMQIAPERAVAELCNVVGKSNDKIICAAVGRAFRESGNAAHYSEHICSLLTSRDWKRRRAGAFVAGFLDQSMIFAELRSLALGDSRWDVCAEAQGAIRSHQRETEAANLVATSYSIEPSEVWGAMDCIVQLADPTILTLAGDPLGFLAMLKLQPYVVRKYASDAIKKRKKKVDADMTSLHGKWKNEDD